MNKEILKKMFHGLQNYLLDNIQINYKIMSATKFN